MSDLSSTKRAQSMIAELRSGPLRRRLPYYAVVAAIGVLALAYIDGGEEPLHPIVHRIAGTATAGDAQ